MFHIPPPLLAQPQPALLELALVRANTSCIAQNTRSSRCLKAHGGFIIILVIIIIVLAVRSVRIVVFLGEALVMNAVWVANLVVKETWQDKADRGGACGADIRKYAVELGDCQGSDVGEYNDKSCKQGEAKLGHDCDGGTVAVCLRCRDGKAVVAAGRVLAVVAVRSPSENGVKGRSAWVDLERHAERDENDYSRFANS